MDPESLSVEAVLRVTDWLRTKWEMRRANTAPVQQWVDSIPSLTTDQSENNSVEPHKQNENQSNPKVLEPMMTVTSVVVNSPPIITPSKLCPNANKLARDLSIQSDSSHCSSVESLLELRKPDPEAILLSLGFGGSRTRLEDNGPLSRIPKRFLKPSTLKGIDIDQFIRKQNQATESLDSASLGYRGLTGTPYVAPSEIVQKIIERLHEHDNQDREQQDNNDNKFSVLSPDNRHFLEQNRSKSPDMRKKRMIIGQKSFVFAKNGELIELEKATCSTKDNQNAEESEGVINEELDDSSEESGEDEKSCNKNEMEQIVNAPDSIHKTQFAFGPHSTCDTPNSKRGSLRKQRRINDEDTTYYLDSLS